MYILDSIAISPLDTWEGYPETLRVVEGNKYFACEPPYEGLIPASQLRRMGRALRMGIACGVQLLSRNAPVDGIIIGTSEGGLEGCISFLNQIVDYNEGTLTPTNFVQSTPNAVSGHLALVFGNSGYNITHVSGGLSFENALIDAKMLFEEGKAESLLVGNVEEISDYNYNIGYAAGRYKQTEASSEKLIGSGTPGSVAGEGSAMFVLSKQGGGPGAVRVLDVAGLTNVEEADLHEYVRAFVTKNGLEVDDIDALVAGFSGDAGSDHYYSDLHSKLFPSSSLYSFKNAVGEYPTVTGFALKMTVDMLRGSKLPDELMLKQGKKEVKRTLIYNYFRGIQHALMLVVRD